MRKNDGKQHHFNPGANADQEMRWQENIILPEGYQMTPPQEAPARRNVVTAWPKPITGKTCLIPGDIPP